MSLSEQILGRDWLDYLLIEYHVLNSPFSLFWMTDFSLDLSMGIILSCPERHHFDGVYKDEKDDHVKELFISKAGNGKHSISLVFS